MNLLSARAVIRALGLGALACLLGLAAHAQSDAAAPKPAGSSFAYAVTKTDKLRVNVYQEDDLSIITSVNSKGAVNLYLVGEVHVDGLTITEAEKAIENAYREGRFLRNPKVQITIEEYAPRAVTIYGQVKNPGRVPLPTETTMTIMQLIGKVGGFTDVGNGKAVIVTRITPDGKKTVLGPIDVESMIRGKDKASVESNALVLMPEDIINVPMRVF